MATATPTDTVETGLELDNDEDAFSDLGASIASDTTTVASNIRNHMYENGRRYHSYKEGQYPLPNDEPEQDRLDILHHVYSLLLDGKLHLAPICENPQRILDLGTGTGIWAIDMADKHPSAIVTGIDLSPIQPGWVPQNCFFEIDDLNEPFTFPHKFDFIHSRNVAQGISDFEAYVKRIFDHLEPGGTCQLVEAYVKAGSDDDTIPHGGAMDRWQTELERAMKAMGVVDWSLRLCDVLRNAGFENVEGRREKVPLGPWPKDKAKKELGRWGREITLPGYESYGVALFTRTLDMDKDEAEKICKDAAVEAARWKEIHAYTPQMFAWGTKPMDA